MNSSIRVDCPNFLLEPLYFTKELLDQLRAVRPKFKWYILPDREPLRTDLNTFFVCCRSPQKNGRFALFSAVLCEREEYEEAPDRKEWVKQIAAEAVRRLPIEFAKP